MGDVWVYWRCEGMDDVSRVGDLSVGGLFLSTPVPPPVGAKAKFTAITDKDCPQLVALLNRIRTLSSTPTVPSFVAASR